MGTVNLYWLKMIGKMLATVKTGYH